MAVQRAEFVILGGGISGLAAAFYLRSSKAVLARRSREDWTDCRGKIVVLEGSPRVGGWIHSIQTSDGAVHERGTRSIRPVGVVGRNTLDLVSDIGIGDTIIPVTHSHAATKNRFIYTHQGLHRLPSSLGGVVSRQAPFSQSVLSRLLREPFAQRCKDEDESIHDFFSRRLGSEIAEYLADPFCRGIFAGDSRELSMRACFPAVFGPERKYGSMIIGGFRHKPEKRPEIGTSELSQRAQKEKWASWSMKNGLKTLPTRLAEWLEEQGIEIRRSTPCDRILFESDETADTKAKVVTEGTVWEAKHVICSTPAEVTQQLLRVEHATLSGLLDRISSCTVAVVNLEYDNLNLPVTGFGYLVPSSVKSDVLGVVFDSCAFPQLDRRRDPTYRITCMMGGAWFNKLFGNPHSVDSNDLLTRALAAIRDQLGITQKPVFSNVTINHNCIPQYRVGHTKLIDDITSYITQHRLPLTLVGSSYCGVSVNDCIFNAREAVKRISV